MNIIVLIYLILMIVSFILMLYAGTYRNLYILNCHENPVLFAAGSIILTAAGPFWVIYGFIKALIG